MFIEIHEIFVENQVSIQQHRCGYTLLSGQCAYFYPFSNCYEKQTQSACGQFLTVLNIQIELLGEICLDIYGDGFQLRDIILGNAYLHAFRKYNAGLVIKSRGKKTDEMTLHNLHLKATCGVW